MEASVVFFGSEKKFGVGDIVANFGHIARIVRVESDGSFYVREIGKRTEWVADPAKCEAVR